MASPALERIHSERAPAAAQLASAFELFNELSEQLTDTYRAMEERVSLLMEDYDFFVKDTAFFCDRLEALISARGHEVVKRWQALAQANDCETVVRELLIDHYDPVYFASMKRNFKNYGAAKLIAPKSHSTSSIAELAVELVKYSNNRT